MRSTVLGTLATTLLAVGTLPTNAAAQYGQQSLTLPGKQLHFLVHDKLGMTPMQLGAEGPHMIARFEPTDDGDFIWGKYGKYEWGLYVYDFESRDARASSKSADDSGQPISREEAERLARAAAMESQRAASFENWAREKDRSKESREFVIEGKVKKATSKRPGFAWWEYRDTRKISVNGKQDEIVFYKTACVYDLGDRELALLCVVPLKKGNKPDSKFRGIAKRMIESLQIEEVEDEDAELDARRDLYADTPARQAALAKLKANIGDVKNWDYFTSPNYLFTFSWEVDKRAKKKDSYRFAREMEARLEEIREKFAEFYPPEKSTGSIRRVAPVTGSDAPEAPAADAPKDEVYSVIRICNDYEEFRKYGNTPHGVVGWFSPGSKELVIFYDAGKIFMNNEDEMLAVCYHEAWHQYSDQYFPGVELHRWFDEGLAEYFGSLRLKGRRWSHVYHKDRLTSLKEQENSDTLIPSAEIVTWHKDKFYGPRAPDHYAQAWAMLDFLIRGKDVLGRRWNDRWSEILPIYAQVCLDQRSEKKAVEAAFEGVDWEEFEKAWIDWFDGSSIKRK